RYLNQNLTDVFFAEEWNGRLVLAGLHGIFVYDPALRSWHRSQQAEIRTLGPCEVSSCFYFGYNGGVGKFSAAMLNDSVRPPIWQLPQGEIPRQISGIDPATALVLTVSGKLLSLGDKQSVTEIANASSSDVPPGVFDRAVAMGDDVLLVAPAGAVLHNISSR